MLALSVVNIPRSTIFIDTVIDHNNAITNRKANINNFVDPKPLSFTVLHNGLSLATLPSHYFKLADFVSTLYWLVGGVIHCNLDSLESEELSKNNDLVVVLLK